MNGLPMGAEGRADGPVRIVGPGRRHRPHRADRRLPRTRDDPHGLAVHARRRSTARIATGSRGPARACAGAIASPAGTARSSCRPAASSPPSRGRWTIPRRASRGGRDQRIDWVSNTTGDDDGVDVTLDAPPTATLSFRTPVIDLDLPLADLASGEMRVFWAGGVDLRAFMRRLPARDFTPRAALRGDRSRAAARRRAPPTGSASPRRTAPRRGPAPSTSRGRHELAGSALRLVRRGADRAECDLALLRPHGAQAGAARGVRAVPAGGPRARGAGRRHGRRRRRRLPGRVHGARWPRAGGGGGRGRRPAHAPAPWRPHGADARPARRLPRARRDAGRAVGLRDHDLRPLRLRAGHARWTDRAAARAHELRHALFAVRRDPPGAR